MQTAIAILTNTPSWVFALLALLIWQGCMALRPRSQPLPRMLIVPAVFFLMGLSRLALGGKSIGLLLVWVACAAVFVALALDTGPRSVTIEGETGRILRPGSVVPLLRNLTVFVLQYAVAVVTAMKLGAYWEVAAAGQAVSGACAGYFLGWTIALLRSYRARVAAPAMP
jgi:prepilin signal peptidase PulO-like enzyme (type II secretory pathway)